MKPFDQYPGDGVTLLPKDPVVNTRRADGPRLQRSTNQTSCAYCGVSLVDNFEHWLLMSIDHVIPQMEGKRLGIPPKFIKSYSNTVLCCSGCNGWDNRYRIHWNEAVSEWTLPRFVALRNRVFQERKERILHKRADEIRFYWSRPWEQPIGA